MLVFEFLDVSNGEYFVYRKGCSAVFEGDSNIGATFSFEDALRLTDSYVWKVTVDEKNIRVECFNPNLPASETLISDETHSKRGIREYIKFNNNEPGEYWDFKELYAEN